MPTRAMWKGVIRFGEVRVPVKLYAAVEDRSVHFRLLHAKDQAPVKQALVNPRSDTVVTYQETRRAFVSPAGDLVVLRDEELAALEPRASRDIEVVAFLRPAVIDHRWYLRPYYLGPDEGGIEAYFGLAAALRRGGREGLARWVMRRKEYVGALRLQAGYPMLIALRHAEEVVSPEDLKVPGGAPLDQRELAMARQLVEMLAADFELSGYQNEYRRRVEELIQIKASGGKVETLRPRRPWPSADLAGALEASLKQERKRV